MTAAQHAAKFQDPAGRQRFLARYRFQLGAVRAWVYPDGVQVRIELLQFEVGELARGFVVAQEQDLASRYPPDSVRVVPQVTTGRAYTSTGNGLGLTRVVFRRGDVVAELAYGNPGTPDPDEAVRQALGQFERL
jgi:hypothetical protein